MKQELALPENKKIIPKPTKNEIIAAMVEIAREKHDAHIMEKKAELDAFQKMIQKRYMKAIKDELKTKEIKIQLLYGEVYTNVHACLKPDKESHELSDKEMKLERETRAVFDEKGTRALLREELLGVSQHAERIEMLLNDKDSRAHLEAVLHGITNPPAEIAA